MTHTHQGGDELRPPLPPPTQQQPASKRSWRTPGAVVLSIVGGLAIVGVGVGISADDGTTPIQDAARECVAVGNVSDDGHSISFDTAGEEDYDGDTLTEVACTMLMLDMPQSLVDRLDHTRALDGMQTGGWDGYKASWTYHPDDGLFLTIDDEINQS